jgi:hypothetical protein
LVQIKLEPIDIMLAWISLEVPTIHKNSIGGSNGNPLNGSWSCDPPPNNSPLGEPPLSKLGYGWICCTSTPMCVVGALGTTSYREVISFSFINIFNLSSTKGQFFNSCPTYWQYAHVNVISTVGWVVVAYIFCWTSGRSIIPMIGTFNQKVLWNGCVCWITTMAMIVSTNSTSCREPNPCEGLRSKLHSFSN